MTKSRRGQVLAAVSFMIALAVVVIVIAVTPHPLTGIGVAVIFGSAVPRNLAPWANYSATTFKRLSVLRFVGVLVGLVLVALGAVLSPSDAPIERGPKTWIVQPGATFTLTPSEVRPDDRYLCPGHPSIDFTPHEGTGYTEEGGLSVRTTHDSVTVSCESSGSGT